MAPCGFLQSGGYHGIGHITLYEQIYRYQPVQDVIFSSNLVKVFAPQRAQYILRLKRIRQGEDEDLPPSKQTKCRMGQSNKTKVKCANCLLFVCGKCSGPVCHTCLNAEDFEEGVN